jgi:hypothetical protein
MQKIVTMVRYIDNNNETIVEEGWRVINVSSTFVPPVKDLYGRDALEKMFIVIILEKI